MSDIREGILKTQLRREIEAAKALEAEGRMSEAGAHYAKAAALYRRVGALRGREAPEEAGRAMETATQYENVGKAMRNPETKAQIKDADLNPEIYEEVVSSLIVTEKPDTRWDDIGGLEEVKDVIKEAIILPFIKNKPKFVKSPRTVLLYGPPGTGKTMLAKASSNMLSATFFEAKASVLLSKYFGESSKLVSALFRKARKMQPSLLFIDELDALAVARTGSMNEASRRVLTEFMQEMEGFGTKKEDRMIIIAATNKPWDLDDAMVSRFQRRLFIPLPDLEARRSIISLHLKGAELSGISIGNIAQNTEYYSGRDLANVCEEAIIGMVREQNPKLRDITTESQIDGYSIRTRPLTQKDFERALKKIKPTTSLDDLEKFQNWEKNYGG
ncbi:MAG: ATP-binding protein [Candidatus Aenigmarchaeota archaeon]|nr:ATP-binding protein [Candidatus Aenigmarchaeota archaeon]